MFDSGITARALVERARSEIDIAPIILDTSFVGWMNTVEQLLYTELIRELRKQSITDNASSPVTIARIAPGVGEGVPIYEDIYKVYADGKELIPMTMVGGYVFPTRDCYWKSPEGIEYSLLNDNTPDVIDVFYFVRPKLKTITDEEICEDNIMLPLEWIDIMLSRLRGEAYKLVNEDGISAKWLNDYNNLIEQFKVWLATKTGVKSE